MLLVANLGEADIKQAAAWLERSGLSAFASQPGLAACAVAAPIEAEMAELAPEDAQAFRDDLGLAEPGLDGVIRSTYELLGLGPVPDRGRGRVPGLDDQARHPRPARRRHHPLGHRARLHPRAGGGVLGSRGGRLARGLPGEGTLRLEGREYLVQDGDVIEFKFNV